MFSNSNEESTTPDNSPLHRRTKPLSLAQHHMNCQQSPTPDTDISFQDVTDDEEEDFPHSDTR